MSTFCTFWFLLRFAADYMVLVAFDGRFLIVLLACFWFLSASKQCLKVNFVWDSLVCVRTFSLQNIYALRSERNRILTLLIRVSFKMGM